MKALLLTDMEYLYYAMRYDSAQADALGWTETEALGWSDNGGDPDGNAWILWNIDLSTPEVKEALRRGAEIIDVYEADYAEFPMKETMEQFLSGEEWSGVGDGRMAVFVNRRDAELCQAVFDRWQEDDDIETIAHRVHSIATATA